MTGLLVGVGLPLRNALTDPGDEEQKQEHDAESELFPHLVAALVLVAHASHHAEEHEQQRSESKHQRQGHRPRTTAHLRTSLRRWRPSRTSESSNWPDLTLQRFEESRARAARSTGVGRPDVWAAAVRVAACCLQPRGSVLRTSRTR